MDASRITRDVICDRALRNDRPLTWRVFSVCSIEPIVEQRLQHATWPQRKETINRTDVLLADQDEEFEEEFTGKLALTEAPPCAFFSIETVEGKKIPR